MKRPLGKKIIFVAVPIYSLSDKMQAMKRMYLGKKDPLIPVKIRLIIE